MLIEDGQIIVLGGLIQDSQSDTTQKLPFLGDIPVAGALFLYDTLSRSKTNLMVFLRPTIVRNGASAGRSRPAATTTSSASRGASAPIRTRFRRSCRIWTTRGCRKR